MGDKGITLIELIVVMAIIAIGALLMAPTLSSWGFHYRLNSGTKDIASTMRLAQMKAVSNNMDYQVLFEFEENGCYVILHNSGGNRFTEDHTNWETASAGTKKLYRKYLPKTITLESANFVGGYFARFNPNSTSNSGSVTLRNIKGMKKTISLLSNGRIRTID